MEEKKIKNIYVVEKKRMKNLKPFLASKRDLSPSRSERETDLSLYLSCSHISLE